jgi:hypothetical protein
MCVMCAGGTKRVRTELDKDEQFNAVRAEEVPPATILKYQNSD